MKKLIFVIFLLAGIHLIGTAQDSKTKVDGADYKKKVENKGTHHTAMYAQGSKTGHVAHHYRRHSAGHRHIAYRRHVYHKHIAHNKKHVYSKPVAHHKKIKEDNKKGEYKVKT